MARARHVGKIALDLSQGTVSTEASGWQPVKVSAGRTWVVTGGLGGFGLAVASWLCEQGATHLVLVGRSGASRIEAQELVLTLQDRGVTVRVEAVDVADEISVRELVQRVSAELPPLQGVVHGAMVLDDGPLATLDSERLRKVMGPKAQGAWNLHLATEGLPLEAFVMFSSVATFIGNAGQGSYVAANSFLDTLAWYRRARGLPALTVNWGAISDTGVVARQRGTGLHLENLGILGMTSADCVRQLGVLLQKAAVQVGVVEMNWPRWREMAGMVARSPRFARMVGELASDGRVEHPKVTELRGVPEPERLPIVLALVREQLARVMHTDTERIDVTLMGV
jgi:NAD(P)-dependent dehydrogenase (short-subunit alcohol dehydrogenase family)